MPAPTTSKPSCAGWADAVWTQGKRFGTIACLRAGQKYEITTHRAEAYHPDSRKPEVAFGDSIEDDLSRRDFTVNAMALRLPDLELIDPFGGLVDLAERRLRTPLDPEVSFADDPLRMLRAARFMARLDLEPTADLVAAVAAGHHRLSIVSAERIRDELDKIMVVPVPSVALWFIVRTGLAEDFLPELPGLAVEQDPIHRHKDVLAHTLAVVDKTSPDRLLRLAALFHDVGKPSTRAFVDGGVTFHHHEVVGARMTRKRMQALRYPNDEVDTVTELVNLHLRFHTYRLGWTDRAVRRYVRDAGPLLDQLNELTRCDCTTRNAAKARALDRRMDELEARIAAAARAGGARRHPARPRRCPGDGPPRYPAGTRGRARRCPSCSNSGWTKAPSVRRRPSVGSMGGGPARGARPGSRPPARRAGGQSSGQTGPGSPAANASTISWADVVVVLHRRRLHEVGGRAEQRAADAPVEGELGAAHGVDDHASRSWGSPTPRA